LSHPCQINLEQQDARLFSIYQISHHNLLLIFGEGICEAAGEQQAETCTTGAGTPESSLAGYSFLVACMFTECLENSTFVLLF
jgi:hypothetical protein